MQLSKNAQALLEGYILFDVNGQRFTSYEAARARRVEITESQQAVAFKGLNVFRMRWEYFYISVYPRPACEVLVTNYVIRPNNPQT